MSDLDQEFPEGDATSEAADVVETGEPAARDAKQGGIDSTSVSDAPVQRVNRAAHRTAAARKAFAEAVVASKAAAAAKPPTELDELDPEAPMVPEAKPLDALKDIAKAKAAAADAPPAAAEAPKPAPPAPSLDPEVRKLREQLKQREDAIAAREAELAKRAEKPAEEAPRAAVDIEAYLDNAPSAVRGWFESMRADKMTDEEFKSEVADLITMLSSDVLGVPLPENVRTKLEAAQAKKMVRTNKMLQTRKEQEAQTRADKERAAAAEKAEIERVEQEWTKASQVLSQQFTGAESAAVKAHPWLAAEDEPGKIIVDVIRAAVTRDGTQLSWQEAAKQANDYLKAEAEKYYSKRKPLLSGETVKPAVSAAKPAQPAPKPAEPARPAVTTTRGRNGWSREQHAENTKAAFRAMIAGKTE